MKYFDINDDNYENELDKVENSLNTSISNDEMEYYENNDNLYFEEFHPKIRNKTKKKEIIFKISGKITS